MTKELFIKCINHMQELYNKGEQFSTMLQTMDSESSIMFNIYSSTITFLTEILKELTNDTYDEIGYYLWELDFGKGYYDGCITTENGEIIKLSTPEELWELIQNDNKN